VTLAQSFLNPTSKTSLLPPVTMQEWLKPHYAFPDGVTSVGIPWELTRTRQTFGRTIEEYSKSGSFSTLFSMFTIIPTHSFATVVLTASKVNWSIEIHRLAMEYFLPAFDKALVEATENALAGTWIDEDETIELGINVSAGSLYATRYIVNGTDALATLSGMPKVNRVPIWSLGNDEYRLRSVASTHVGATSCLESWGSLDEFTYMNGYAVNLLRVLPNKSGPRLEIPAMKVVLTRK